MKRLKRLSSLSLRVSTLGSNILKVDADATVVRQEWRFGDLTAHPTLDIVVCVREDHTHPDPEDVQTTLVAIHTKTNAVSVIVQSWDFYADPIFSPDGRRLAYTKWNHTDSAFHSMQLLCADVMQDGESISLANEIVLAGEPSKSIAQQPQWLSNDELMAIFDVSGWGQPWKFHVGGSGRPILPSPTEEDFSEAHWLHGISTYAALNSKTAICSALVQGIAKLFVLDIDTGSRQELDSPYVVVRQVRRVSESSIVFIGTRIDQGPAIIRLTLTLPSGDSGWLATFEVLSSSSTVDLPPAYIPMPQTIQAADDQGRPLHVTYFPPTSGDYKGPADEKPPAVISYHSGPNHRPLPGFDWIRLLYTSRGWAW